MAKKKGGLQHYDDGGDVSYDTSSYYPDYGSYSPGQSDSYTGGGYDPSSSGGSSSNDYGSSYGGSSSYYPDYNNYSPGTSTDYTGGGYDPYSSGSYGTTDYWNGSSGTSADYTGGGYDPYSSSYDPNSSSGTNDYYYQEQAPTYGNAWGTDTSQNSNSYSNPNGSYNSSDPNSIYADNPWGYYEAGTAPDPLPSRSSGSGGGGSSPTRRGGSGGSGGGNGGGGSGGGGNSGGGGSNGGGGGGTSQPTQSGTLSQIYPNAPVAGSGGGGGHTPFQLADLSSWSHAYGGHIDGYKEGGEPFTPQFYSQGGLNNTYVKGSGDGTSDSVPAMLANGEFVIPADVVSALGNGSNDAGADKLTGALHSIRKQKQKNGTGLPPDSKDLTHYIVKAKHKVKA